MIKLVFFSLLFTTVISDIRTCKCTGRTQQTCFVDCGCYGCDSTKICNDFENGMGQMRKVNPLDKFVENATNEVRKVCKMYEKPDWKFIKRKVKTNCVNRVPEVNCTECPICNRKLICTEMAKFMNKVKEHYNDSSQVYLLADNVIDVCAGNKILPFATLLFVILFVIPGDLY
jgi:hypothetical protein